MPKPTICTQANEVLLCRQGIGLKKLTMTIKTTAEARIQTSIARFKSIEILDGP